MVVIKNNTIPYLDENVLNSFNNVTMKSIEGSQIKMNSLILCAMSHSMAMSLHEDESEHTIITEHSLEELEQVKIFCMTGACDPMMSQSILLAFGLTNNNKLKVKNEVMEVKLEPIDYDDDDDNEDWDYETYSKQQIKTETKTKRTKKASKPIKKKKAKLLEEDDFNDENYELDYGGDESWKPDELFEKRNSYKSIGKLEEFKTFELPKPLEEYTKPPNKIKEDMWSRCKNKEENMFDASLLKCPECDLTFQKTIILRLHVIKYHNEHLQCDLCDSATKVEDAEEFKRHMFRHIVLGKGGLKECVQCGKTKKRKEHLAKHLKQRGPLHNDECSQCSEKMSSFKAYQDHVNDRHSGVWKFKCGYCGDLYETSRLCNRHTTIVHLRTNPVNKINVPKKPKKEKVREICDLCGLTFASLATHKNRVHYQKVIVEEKEQRCDQCGQIFETKLKLYHHKRNVHTKKQCPYCGDMIRCVHLNNHIRRNHTGDMPYKCDICGKGFLYQNRLDEHNNTHTGEKPFQCKYCPSVFASAGNKAAHERGHLGIKRRK